MRLVNEKAVVDDTIKRFKLLKKYIEDKYANIFRQELEKALTLAVDDFYDAYYPNTYRRGYQMYKSFMIRKTRKYTGIYIGNWGSHISNSGKQSNDYVYDLVMHQGYHGGPMWMTPPDFKIPYGEAVKSTPVLELMRERAMQCSIDVQEKAQAEYDKLGLELIRRMNKKLGY